MSGNGRAWAEKLLKALGKYKYVLLVAAVGALLLLLPEGGGGQPAAQVPEGRSDLFQVGEMEDKLEKALSQVEGQGR